MPWLIKDPEGNPVGIDPGANKPSRLSDPSLTIEQVSVDDPRYVEIMHPIEFLLMEKIDEIKREYQQRSHLAFIENLGEHPSFGIQISNIDKMNSTLMALANGWITECKWNTLENVFQVFTAEDFRELTRRLYLYVQDCYAAKEHHRDAVNALEGREAIAAYDCSGGWPEQTLTG